MIAVILTYGILAFTFLLSKVTITYAHPLFIVTVRLLLAGIGLLSYAAFTEGKVVIDRFIRSHFLLLFIVSGLHAYLPFILEFYALTTISATKASAFYGLTPLIVTAIAWKKEGYRLNAFKMSALLLGFFATLLLINVPIHSLFFMQGHLPSLHETALLLSVITSGYAWFFIKDLMKEGYSPVLINGLTMTVGGILSLLTVVVIDATLLFTFESAVWPSLLSLTFFSHGAFYIFYSYLTRTYSLPLLTTAGMLCPAFTAVVSRLFLSETIYAMDITALSLIGASLVLLTYGESE